MSAFFKKAVLVTALLVAVFCFSASWSQAGERHHGGYHGHGHYGQYHRGHHHHHPGIYINIAPVRPIYGPYRSPYWGARRYVGPPAVYVVPRCGVHHHAPWYW